MKFQLWWRLRRRPTPEPLALGRPVEFQGAGWKGQPMWFVPVEFVRDPDGVRIVFQDQASYDAHRLAR